MGLTSRDVTVNHDGHEIALSVALIGSSFSTGQYKLYINGHLADEQSIPALSYVFGGAVTLRVQLPPDNEQSKQRKVKSRSTRNGQHTVACERTLPNQPLRQIEHIICFGVECHSSGSGC